MSTIILNIIRVVKYNIPTNYKRARYKQGRGKESKLIH